MKYLTSKSLTALAVLLLASTVSAIQAFALDKHPPGAKGAANHSVAVSRPAGKNATKASGDRVMTISIPLDKAHLLALPGPVRDVIVPNPNIVDIIIKKPTQVYLVAKKVGETNIFFVGKNGNVILHVEAVVQIGLHGARAAIASIFPDGGIKLISINKTIVISGSVRSAKDSANAMNVVRRFVQSDTEVINMLKVIEDQQVLLKVRVAEIQRSVLKTLGTDIDGSFGNRLSFSTRGAGAGPAQEVFGAIFADINEIGLDSVAITALEARGLAKTLAEPALVAISGETANFLAGGEFPVPTGRDEDDNITVQFKNFGVSLSFTPVVLSKSQISLRIKTEVSRLDPSEEVQLNGTTVKGLSVRRADSTVSMGSGQGIMIAGLIQNDEFNEIQGMPWLKDVPVLGPLFSSRGFKNNRTELVIMITAYIARPTHASAQPSLPTDGFVPASDFDFYLMGQLYKRYAKRARPDAAPMVRGPVGYLME